MPYTAALWPKGPKVSREEIDAIYSNIQAKKQLVTFPLAGHENYLLQYKPEWTEAVGAFLSSHIKNQQS